MAGDSEPFDETERRKQLRLLKEYLGEDFLVKQVQAPGPKPDEVDEKNGEPDHQQGHDPQRPFQNASEHGESVARPPLIRSILYRARSFASLPSNVFVYHLWMRIFLCVIAFLLVPGLLGAGDKQESEITTITLERTPCFGACPVYKLTVHRSGQVEYEGKDHVRQKGSRTGRISTEDFDKLAKKIGEINFFSLQDRYDGKNPDGSGVTVTDLPTRKTSVTWGNRNKTVENYFRGPKGLKELEDLIDELTKSADWVRG
jgi:hypothetical protein